VDGQQRCLAATRITRVGFVILAAVVVRLVVEAALGLSVQSDDGVRRGRGGPVRATSASRRAVGWSSPSDEDRSSVNALAVM
jgi:hypothetical protein